MERSKTRLEIAREYGISRKTLQRWIKRENIKLTKGLITPVEQELIYSRFGRPRVEPGDRRDRWSRWG